MKIQQSTLANIYLHEFDLFLAMQFNKLLCSFSLYIIFPCCLPHSSHSKQINCYDSVLHVQHFGGMATFL